MKHCRSRTRSEAAEAIELALDTLYCGATADQIGDLASAFDAFKQEAYALAVTAARAAVENHAARRRQPAPVLARSLAEIGDEFRAMTRFCLDSGCHAPVPRGEVYATARLMILQHGPWAGDFAAARTETFLGQHDPQSAGVWMRIYRAIAKLHGNGTRDAA